MLQIQPGVRLLFTDVVMPGKTGRQLVDEVKPGRPDLKVLYTTGYTRNAIVHNGVVDPGRPADEAVRDRPARPKGAQCPGQ